MAKTPSNHGKPWTAADNRQLSKSLDVVGHIGRGGRYPGQFYGVHSIATDSHGNIYTGETYEGKRLQRFVREP